MRQRRTAAVRARNPRIVDLRARRNEDRGDRQARTDPFRQATVEEPQPFLAEEPQPEGPIQSGLFLIDTEGGTTHKILGEGPRGVFQLQVPNGRYVVGIEAFSSDAKEAWRDRHGLWQDPIIPGLAAVSDLLILEGGGEIPTSLDEALPTALPSGSHPSRGGTQGGVGAIRTRDRRVGERADRRGSGRPRFHPEIGPVPARA